MRKSNSFTANLDVGRRGTLDQFWDVTIAFKEKTATYYIQIKNSIYTTKDIHYFMSKQLPATDPARVTPFDIRPGDVMVQRRGSGQKIIIEGTKPAEHLDYDAINDSVEKLRLLNYPVSSNSYRPEHVNFQSRAHSSYQSRAPRERRLRDNTATTPDSDPWADISALRADLREMKKYRSPSSGWTGTHYL